MLGLLNPFGSNFNITVVVIFALQLVGEGLSIYRKSYIGYTENCTVQLNDLVTAGSSEQNQDLNLWEILIIWDNTREAAWKDLQITAVYNMPEGLFLHDRGKSKGLPLPRGGDSHQWQR